MREFTIAPWNACKRIGSDTLLNVQDGLDAVHVERRKSRSSIVLVATSLGIATQSANAKIGMTTKRIAANGENKMQRSEIIILGEEGQCVCWVKCLSWVGWFVPLSRLAAPC